jgi:hypothetical protein
MPVPDFARDFKNYERFDIGAMGEFDVALLVDQYAGTQVAHHVYPNWRGGYYYAGRPKGDPSAPLAVLYVSRWASPQAAAEFAAIYARSLAQRYRHATEVLEHDGRPITLEKLVSLTGTHTWLTEEGPVVIAQQGTTLLITESLDGPSTDTLERELLPSSRTGEDVHPPTAHEEQPRASR